MLKICNACGQEKEHKSWKSTTCDECLAKGIKFCSECNEVFPVSNFQLCRGKPIGRCRQCENKRSYEGKKQSGYLDRPDIIAKRNEESRICKAKVHQDPIRRRQIYDRHNERLRERYKQDANYKEKVIASNRKYKEGLQGILTADDWEDALIFFEVRCAYCGSDDKLSRDHIVAVSKGGLNERTNVIPCCISCNSSKNNNSMEIWYKNQKFFSEKRFAKILEWKEGESRAPKRI